MTFYDDFGREVAEVNERIETGKVHDISEILDHGREPDFTKESLIGVPVIVVGIVGPESFPLGHVYFILLRRKLDSSEDEPWGVMFPAASPVVVATLRAARQKMLPFVGILDRTTSASDEDRQYWNWRRK